MLRDDAFDEQALQRDSQPSQARRNELELRRRREGIVQIEIRGRREGAESGARAFDAITKGASRQADDLWPSAISTRATPSNGLM